ncbi:MAG TPA: hypothetical protein VGM22_19940 [Methylomirabilota bacterium]|jgi:hypothetical protein
MILAFIVVFLAGYVAAAAWGARRGRRPLVSVAGATLAIIVLGSLFLGHQYAVPSVPLLLLYMLAFLGPAVVLPPLLLWGRAEAGAPTLGLALVGTIAGLLAGWVVVVFGLRVW